MEKVERHLDEKKLTNTEVDSVSEDQVPQHLLVAPRGHAKLRLATATITCTENDFDRCGARRLHEGLCH